MLFLLFVCLCGRYSLTANEQRLALLGYLKNVRPELMPNLPAGRLKKVLPKKLLSCY
jgi:hypothetical protein